MSELVAEEIARYLESHPDAADTEEGIRRWWLSPACAAASIETVRLALQSLERRGLIVSSPVIGGPPIHRRRVIGVH